ncbi:hypothetical protein [Sphingomonas sp.]|uniref:hypothetical protein n=1 Tax=Sphingomonas sp. TaxID=28214 RepID=UPI002B73B8B5|nr:hypothetical protein [Sphingomonas sp.]HWK35950.1 hypothetical protein [Sphingomonas sp.]
MVRYFAAFAAAAALVPAVGVSAQPPQATAASDEAMIDATIRDLYAVISGPAGARDWDKFNGLFLPEGRLVPVGDNGPTILTPQGYADRAGPRFLKEGFFESEIARRVERYGNVAHIFSTYESRRAAGEAPFARGINSIQLVRTGGQWKILSITWQGESAAYPIPATYLPAR